MCPELQQPTGLQMRFPEGTVYVVGLRAGALVEERGPLGRKSLGSILEVVCMLGV